MSDPLESVRADVAAALDTLLPRQSALAQPMIDAMRHAVLGGGKRMRPLLTCAACEAFSGSYAVALSPACAFEFIHAYSLIHDDLPAMDDDDLRRGKATCHIQFDEATAILAGDGLQSLAFEQLTELHNIPADQIVKLLSMLASYSGCSGMVAGQAIDLAATGQTLSLEQLKTMHRHKTGALIEAAVLMGAIATGAATEQQLAVLKQFAADIGLAFQIQDDILDVESSTEQLGKQQGSDAANQKSTYSSIMGLEEARAEAATLYQQSVASLDIFAERADPLRQLASFIVNRAY